MSEFQKFGTIPQHEISDALRISELFLPSESTPAVGDDNTLHYAKEYRGEMPNPDGVAYSYITRNLSDDGTDRLVGAKVTEDFTTGSVDTVMYTLVINNGKFLVERETKNVNDTDLSASKPNAYELKQAQSVQFEFGLMKPEENDWSDFKELLKFSAEISQKTSKHSRIAKMFGWLRRN